MAQNTWKEKLQEVRSFVKESDKVESVVEETPVVSEETAVENETRNFSKKNLQRQRRQKRHWSHSKKKDKDCKKI